jgi:hypothetical protein
MKLIVRWQFPIGSSSEVVRQVLAATVPLSSAVDPDQDFDDDDEENEEDPDFVNRCSQCERRRELFIKFYEGFLCARCLRRRYEDPG